MFDQVQSIQLSAHELRHPPSGALILSLPKDAPPRPSGGKTSNAMEVLFGAPLGDVHYARRPNLQDEGDNDLIELAITGGAAAVVTHNVRDLARGELKFPGLKILTPAGCLKEFPCPP